MFALKPSPSSFISFIRIVCIQHFFCCFFRFYLLLQNFHSFVSSGWFILWSLPPSCRFFPYFEMSYFICIAGPIPIGFEFPFFQQYIFIYFLQLYCETCWLWPLHFVGFLCVLFSTVVSRVAATFLIITSLVANFSHQRLLTVFRWSMSDSNSPQVSRMFLSILTDINNAVI